MSLAMGNREGLGGDAGHRALPLTNAENDRVILLLGRLGQAQHGWQDL